VTSLAVVAPRLGQLVRLLGSHQDGEVVAAARAIGRTLKSAGADFHTLAATVEGSEPEVSNRGEYWRDMARWLIDESGVKFSEKEQAFLHDMTTWPDEPSDRQAAWLRRIFESAARQRARTP
jgi:hypothetical protein